MNKKKSVKKPKSLMPVGFRKWCFRGPVFENTHPFMNISIHFMKNGNFAKGVGAILILHS